MALYPTAGLGIGWIRETDLAVALCKAWNDFVSEEFQKVSPRLKGVALVSLNPAASQYVREADRLNFRIIHSLRKRGFGFKEDFSFLLTLTRSLSGLELHASRLLSHVAAGRCKQKLWR